MRAKAGIHLFSVRRAAGLEMGSGRRRNDDAALTAIPPQLIMGLFVVSA
jgi:hypothetical protein